MADQNDIDRVWDIIENNSIGMLTTQFAGGLRARPVDARSDRAAGAIYFVTDARGHKDDEIAARPDVCFVVVCRRTASYLSITGRAAVTCDPAKAREIWKKTDDVWWKGGPDDPNARVLRIEPVTAELWDGPSSSLVAAYDSPRRGSPGESRFSARTARKRVPMG